MSKGSSIWMVAVLLVVTAGLAVAKKPTGPAPADPVDGGVIYYGYSGAVYEMEPDGTGKSFVISEANVEPYSFVPSLLPHDGKRWFLIFRAIANETYPNGQDRYELFAVTASGDSVQLTDDATIDPQWPGTGEDRAAWAMHGGADDGKVSFLARQWGTESGGNDVIVNHGVYWFEVDPDELDAHSAVAHGDGGAFLPVVFTLTDLSRMSADYTWSPSGTAIVFVDLKGDPGLQVAEAANGWDAERITMFGRAPKWSPAGDRISFHDSSDWSVYTVAPDGTESAKIVSGRSGPGFWSPNGTHLVHWKGSGGKGPIYQSLDILRIEDDGSSDTNLTKDIDGRPYPFAWCEE